MPSNLAREAAQLADAVAKQKDHRGQHAFQVGRSTRQHYRFFKADGTFIGDLGGTPGNRRALDNTLAMLKRAGFDPSPKQTRKTRKS